MSKCLITGKSEFLSPGEHEFEGRAHGDENRTPVERWGSMVPSHSSTPWVPILVPRQGARPLGSWCAAQERLKTMQCDMGIMKTGGRYKDNGV